MITFALGVIFGWYVASLLSQSTEYVYTKAEYDEMVKRKNADIDFLYKELRALEHSGRE